MGNASFIPEIVFHVQQVHNQQNVSIVKTLLYSQSQSTQQFIGQIQTYLIILHLSQQGLDLSWDGLPDFGSKNSCELELLKWLNMDAVILKNSTE